MLEMDELRDTADSSAAFTSVKEKIARGGLKMCPSSLTGKMTRLSSISSETGPAVMPSRDRVSADLHRYRRHQARAPKTSPAVGHSLSPGLKRISEATRRCCSSPVALRTTLALVAPVVSRSSFHASFHAVPSRIRQSDTLPTICTVALFAAWPSYGIGEALTSSSQSATVNPCPRLQYSVSA